MDTSKINLSKIKLSKDNLKDCKIVLSCESDYTESFLYKLIQNQFEGFEKIFIATEKNGETILEKYFLSNGKYKILISETQISFNIVGSYSGWIEYRGFILDVIKAIAKYLKYYACQLEYASYHEGMDIFSNIDGIVKLNQFPQIFEGTSLSFNCAPKHTASGDLEVIAHVLLKKGVCIDNKKYSLTAIMVETQRSEKSWSSEIVKDWIDFLHDIQKDLYFKIMDEKYIKRNL